MNTMQGDTNRVFNEAIRWISLFQDGAADCKAFFTWLEESPRHVEELNFALALTGEIGGLSIEQRAAIKSLATSQSIDNQVTKEAAQRLPNNVVTLTTAAISPLGEDGADFPPSVSKSRMRWKHLALAAGLTALVGGTLIGGYVLFGPRAWHTYTTQVGEQRALTLADGSIIQINAHSRLKVQLTTRAREIRLLEGEALFKVEHDAARPFRVHTGDATIVALGTQFDVYRKPASTSVEVLEGAVQITPTTSTDTVNSVKSARDAADLSQPLQVHIASVTAGEKVDIGSGTGMIHRESIPPSEAAPWRQRRLIFHNDTLAEIAAEFNRYNRVQIHVEGQARETRFAGTFDADAPQAFIAAVAAHQELSIERGSQEIVIREHSTDEP